MKRWPILMAVLCLGLLGQDRQASNNRYVLRLIGHTVQLSLEQVGQYGSPESLKKVRAETKAVDLTISADEMEWNHETGEIKMSGNVRVKLN